MFQRSIQLATQMNQQVYEDVLRALNVQLSSQVSNIKRQEAYSYIESFKQNKLDGNCASIALFILHQPQNHTESAQQLGLNVLQEYLKVNWNSCMDDQEKLNMRNEIVALVASGQVISFKKLAVLLGEIVKRQFPQHWLDLFDVFKHLWSLGPVQAQTVMETLRLVAEDCVNKEFNATIPPTRRREILQGLHTLGPEILNTLYAYICTQESSSETLKGALQMLNEYLIWIPIDLITGELVETIVQLLAEKTFTGQAARQCITTLVARSFEKTQFDSLLQLSDALIRRFHTLQLDTELQEWNERIIRDHIVDARELEYFQSLNTILCVWGQTNFHFLIEQSATQLVLPYLQLLLTFLHIPTVEQFDSQRAVWLIVIKEDSESINPILSTLCSAIFARFPKIGHPDRSDHPMCFSSMEQFATSHEFLQAVSQNRNALLAVLMSLMQRFPGSVIEKLHQHAQVVLTQHQETMRRREASAPLTDTDPIYVQYEGITALIDGVLRQMTREVLNRAQQQSPKTRDSILWLLGSFLDSSAQDPLLIYRDLISLSSFSVYYECDQTPLPAVLEKLFTFITFTANDSQSESVQSVRRRACASLVSLCKALPDLMLPCFPGLCERVVALFQNKAVNHIEMMLLFEMLVLVSNSMPDFQQQKAFLEKVVQDPLEFWTSPAITQLVSSSETIATAVVNSDHTLRLLSQKATLLYGVARRVKSMHGEESAFDHIWPHIIPNLIRLIQSLHGLSNPRIKSIVLQQPCTAWLVSITVEEMAVLLGGVEELPPLSLPTVSEWAMWSKNLRDVCYNLLGFALKQPRIYTSIPDLLLGLQLILVDGLDYMEHRHFQQLISFIVIYLVKNCPVTHFSSILQPILTRILVHSTQRLSKAWTTTSTTTSDWDPILLGNTPTPNETVEIISQALRNSLSRQVLDLISAIVENKAQVSEFALLQSDAMASPITILLTGCICWPNTYLCKRGVQLWSLVVESVFAQPKYYPVIGRDLFGTAISALLQKLPHIETDDAKWCIISLLKTIYCLLVLALPLVTKSQQPPKEPLCDFPRRILLSLPNVTTDSVVALENELRAELSSRKRKAIMKEYLEQLLSETTPDQTKQIHDLPQKLVIKSKRLPLIESTTQHLGLDCLFEFL